MSKKNDKLAADAAVNETAIPAAETAAETTPTERENTSATQVYCGVAKQYTVFHGGIPEALEAFIAIHPEAGALVVDVERFAETRKRLETAGTAEAILYGKIKSEL